MQEWTENTLRCNVVYCQCNKYFDQNPDTVWQFESIFTWFHVGLTAKTDQQLPTITSKTSHAPP